MLAHEHETSSNPIIRTCKEANSPFHGLKTRRLLGGYLSTPRQIHTAKRLVGYMFSYAPLSLNESAPGHLRPRVYSRRTENEATF